MKVRHFEPADRAVEHSVEVRSRTYALQDDAAFPEKGIPVRMPLYNHIMAATDADLDRLADKQTSELLVYRMLGVKVWQI